MAVEQRTVSPDEADIRLDRWFKRHFPQLPFGRLSKLMRTGQIRLDGKRVDGAERLEPGQIIRVPPLGDLDSPPPPRTLDPHEIKDLHQMVIHRDADVLVLNKPSGLAVQGGTGTSKHLDGMLDALKFDLDERPRLVHRLDRDTSGILVLARTALAATKLAAAFKARETEKIYWAVTARVPAPEEGSITLRLAKKGGPQGERVAVDDEEGQRAVTDYEVIDTAPPRAALVRLRPITGRTHQLRVHCAAIGCPILGDVKYGQADAVIHGVENARSLHLHARRLKIPHPRGGFLEVTAPVPPHMKKTFAYFGFSVPKGA